MRVASGLCPSPIDQHACCMSTFRLEYVPAVLFAACLAVMNVQYGGTFDGTEISFRCYNGRSSEGCMRRIDEGTDHLTIFGGEEEAAGRWVILGPVFRLLPLPLLGAKRKTQRNWCLVRPLMAIFYVSEPQDLVQLPLAQVSSCSCPMSCTSSRRTWPRAPTGPPLLPTTESLWSRPTSAGRTTASLASTGRACR